MIIARNTLEVIARSSEHWPGIPPEIKQGGRFYKSRFLGADGLYYRATHFGFVACLKSDEAQWCWLRGEGARSGLNRWSDCEELFDERDFAARLHSPAMGIRPWVHPRLIAEATPERLRYMKRCFERLELCGAGFIGRNAYSFDELPGWSLVLYVQDSWRVVWVERSGVEIGFFQRGDGWTFLTQMDSNAAMKFVTEIGEDFVERLSR